jgi:hypothetical protein
VNPVAPAGGPRSVRCVTVRPIDVEYQVNLVEDGPNVTPRRREFSDETGHRLALVKEPCHLVEQPIELIPWQRATPGDAPPEEFDIGSRQPWKVRHQPHYTNSSSYRTVGWYSAHQGSTCIPPTRRLVERRRDRSIAMQDTYDPFSFLLNEIRAHDAGLRNWSPGQRDHYLDELLADEAQEIAWGRRHLSVVHGEVLDEVEAETLDDIVCALLDLIDGAWHRFGGLADHHFTLTIVGPDADDVIGRAAEVITRCKPDHWRVIATAVVEVSR